VYADPKIGIARVCAVIGRAHAPSFTLQTLRGAGHSDHDCSGPVAEPGPAADPPQWRCSQSRHPGARAVATLNFIASWNGAGRIQGTWFRPPEPKAAPYETPSYSRPDSFSSHDISVGRLFGRPPHLLEDADPTRVVWGIYTGHAARAWMLDRYPCLRRSWGGRVWCCLLSLPCMAEGCAWRRSKTCGRFGDPERSEKRLLQSQRFPVQ